MNTLFNYANALTSTNSLDHVPLLNKLRQALVQSSMTAFIHCIITSLRRRVLSFIIWKQGALQSFLSAVGL